MEERLKFNSQICTTKEQSQRLLDLGLKPETADMIYMQIDGSWICIISQGDEEYVPYEDHFPAWSLHRLREIGNIENVGFTSIKNAYDTCVSMIASHIKFGLLNKEYLKQ